MADFSAAHPNQKRLRGAGWFVANWDDPTLPDKRSLDMLIPDRPVYLQCADAYSFWLNSKAIEECGVDPDLKMDNGIICKFPDGELTGLLLEPAAYVYHSEQETGTIEPGKRENLIVIDSSLLGVDEMAKLLAVIVRRKFGCESNN